VKQTVQNSDNTSASMFSCSYKCWETLFKARSAYQTCAKLVISLEWHKFSSQLALKAQFKIQFIGLKLDSFWSSICSSIW